MKAVLSLISYICGLLAAFFVFFVCIYVFQILDRLTGRHYSNIWTFLTCAVGLILGLIAAGIVKNLIYKEPTRF